MGALLPVENEGAGLMRPEERALPAGSSVRGSLHITIFSWKNQDFAREFDRIRTVIAAGDLIVFGPKTAMRGQGSFSTPVRPPRARGASSGWLMKPWPMLSAARFRQRGI